VAGKGDTLTVLSQAHVFVFQILILPSADPLNTKLLTLISTLIAPMCPVRSFKREVALNLQSPVWVTCSFTALHVRVSAAISSRVQNGVARANTSSFEMSGSSIFFLAGFFVSTASAPWTGDVALLFNPPISPGADEFNDPKDCRSLVTEGGTAGGGAATPAPLECGCMPFISAGRLGFAPEGLILTSPFPSSPTAIPSPVPCGTPGATDAFCPWIGTGAIADPSCEPNAPF